VEPDYKNFTGDHGQSLGEHGESTHGYFAYNSTLWVPLIISCPGFQSRRVDDNVCHLDIFPTVCELLGNSPPAYLQGESLVKAMKGKNYLTRKFILNHFMLITGGAGLQLEAS